MNEEKFNMEMRKFLKKVGITSQRMIEQAVRDAIAEDRLKGNEEIEVNVNLEIKALKVNEPIAGTISLE